MSLREIGGVVDGVLGRRAGLKTLVFGSARIRNKRKTYAVAAETLRYQAVLQSALADAGLPAGDGFTLVVAYELLFGQKLRAGGKVVRAVRAKEAELRASVAAMVRRGGHKSAADLVAPPAAAFPRWARVNTLRATVEDVRAELPDAEEDGHIRGLLRLPAGTELHEHACVTGGRVILQDKASCMPAEALVRALGGAAAGDVLDACAAPGNKTSHLAALLQPGGRRVVACDRDAARLELLRRRMREAGADGVVEARCCSFLDVDPAEPALAGLRGILLDPSCSGSGMVSRLDHALEDGRVAGRRLARLAAFQLSCLRAAMAFPQVEFISYSTCSVHEEEDEAVVAQALAAGGGAWELYRALPEWPRRGRPVAGLSPAQAEALVRVDPAEDETNGFFVGLFRRVGPSPAAAAAAPAPAAAVEPKRRKAAEPRKPKKAKQVLGKTKTKAKKGRPMPIVAPLRARG